MRQVLPNGPIPARVMVIGDFPSYDDTSSGSCFSDSAGKELDKMLHEAGISRSECFVTTACKVTPPRLDLDHFIAHKKKDRTPAHKEIQGLWVTKEIAEGYQLIQTEIAMVQPKIIITFGNLGLWVTTGLWGITKWRGSMLYWSADLMSEAHVKVIPTYSPAAILRQWDWRAIALNDLKRAKRFINGEAYPRKRWETIVRPSADKAVQILRGLLAIADNHEKELIISFDLETRHSHIACAGISWSSTPDSYLHEHALCIPLMCVENKAGYWTQEEEAAIVYYLYRLLTHKRVRVVGQNLLYDSQYTYRHWHFIPNVHQDTMLSHHAAWLGLPKRLDFQASMYCDHYVYWKDDGKEWDRKMGEDQLWSYNGEDAARTAECAGEERKVLTKLNLEQQEAFLQSMFHPVLQAMIRGVRIDTRARDAMASELMDEMAKREQYFVKVLGHPVNPRSPKQMAALVYDDLKQPIIRNRYSGNPTLDSTAMEKLARREPLLRPIFKNIEEYRSLGVFLSTFVKAPLDADLRMRCSYNLCGTETLRLSSSENAFGSGTNLQNLPKGTKAKEPEDLSLPNIRKMFIPDPGYLFFDMDLDRADLQVVVWEADDAELKTALRMGVDMHCMNACSIFNIKGIPVDELVETHSNYKERRGQIGEGFRQKAKAGCHAVNYYCQENTLATHLNCSTREAKAFMTSWFGAHPGIKKWHDRTSVQLNKFRFVENAFGFKRFYFDRIEHLLPEALAWQPQSTVALTINHIWRNIYRDVPLVQVLLQVHDSLAGQIPIDHRDECLAKMHQASKIIIPYPDPLVIPAGIKLSETSWGACA